MALWDLETDLARRQSPLEANQDRGKRQNILLAPKWRFTPGRMHVRTLLHSKARYSGKLPNQAMQETETSAATEGNQRK